MARITVDDCLKRISNRFQLTLAATYRARQLGAGASPQVYRICKAGSASADDCGVEVLVNGKRALALERQSATSCSCADVEGSSIEVRPLAPAGASCGATAQTLWYENLRGH